MQRTNTDMDRILELLADSQRGYSEAVDVADDSQVRQLFADRARSRAQIMEEFASMMPDRVDDNDGGTATGAAHRLFINLKRMVQDDTKVALTEVERGETAFLEALNEALDDSDLSGTARSMVSRLHDQVKADRDKFSALKSLY